MPYILKVVLFLWLIGMIPIIFGAIWILGLNEIKFSGVRKRWVELLSGIVAVAIGVGATFPVTLDYIENNPQELVVYVEGREHPFPASIFRNGIITKDHGIFVNMFYEFDVKQNGYYEIKYLPRSTILTHVEKINEEY